jgi:hypothetical protein
MMKKLSMLPLLLISYYIVAAPDLSAPPPPQVIEPDLNLSVEELKDIQQGRNASKQSAGNDALTKSIGDNRDGVKVIQVGDDTIEEYRRGGQLYQIRVIPKIGKPYFIQPKNENSDNDNKGTNPTSNWKVLTF